MKEVEQTVGAVTEPKGFLASGVRAGIKERGLDLALIVSECPASAAGTFTSNRIKAAPVLLDMERVPSASVRAIVANSGNANAVTGQQGLRDARRMTAEVALRLSINDNDVLVASTGVIGRLLPMERISDGICKAVSSLNREGGADAARAIMTTDTRPKEALARFNIAGVDASIGGIAKGAGMICPNMATMLAFITTDLAIAPELLSASLKRSVEKSFNCLTVDGDTSTNDTVLILANGLAGNKRIEAECVELEAFQSALDSVTVSLAKQIAADGEGATKLVEVCVEGAASFEEARVVAKTIANSPLVKTAFFGGDPNWGRIVAAAGRSGVDFDPSSMKLFLGEIEILSRGEPVGSAEEDARQYLTGSEVRLRLVIGGGPGSATVWTCDFSYDYVRINAEYHT